MNVHTDRKWHHWDSNPGRLASESVLMCQLPVVDFPINIEMEVLLCPCYW